MPKGQTKGLIIHGDHELLMLSGEKYTFTAYDEYYNPLKLEDIKSDRSLSNPIRKFEGEGFIPAKSGDMEITACSGGGSFYECNVIGY